MRHLAVLVALYALLAALLLPGSLLASQEPVPDAPAGVERDQLPRRADGPAPIVTPGQPRSPRSPRSADPDVLPDAAPVPPQAPPTAQPADPQATPSASPEPPPAGERSAGDPAPATAPAPPPAAQRRGAGSSRVARQASAAKRSSRGRAKSVRARAAATVGVTIRDFEFAPATITINQGDTVTWTNEGPSAHSATATGGGFDTKVFPQGESRSHTFGQAGTFPYVCTPHPNMTGTITVQAANSGDGSGSGAGEGTADAGSSGTGSGSDASLPATGRDVSPLAALGLLMLAVGLTLRVGARGRSG
jgi:plastocyanin